MSEHVRVAGCWLDDERTVVSEIDVCRLKELSARWKEEANEMIREL